MPPQCRKIKNRPEISFDTLKGFREILKDQEQIIVPKRILSEDDCDILGEKLQCIRPGTIVTIDYYDKGQYVQLEEKVSKINLDTKIIQIVKTKINLKSVVNIIGKDIEEEYLYIEREVMILSLVPP